jgi:hypothetical protein
VLDLSSRPPLWPSLAELRPARGEAPAVAPESSDGPWKPPRWPLEAAAVKQRRRPSEAAAVLQGRATVLPAELPSVVAVLPRKGDAASCGGWHCFLQRAELLPAMPRVASFGGRSCFLWWLTLLPPAGRGRSCFLWRLALLPPAGGAAPCGGRCYCRLLRRFCHG